jgi:hypothetical protein
MSRIILAISLLIIMMMTPGTSAQSGAPPEVQKAQSLIQAKDYDGAIRVLEPYLQLNPNRLGSWNILAGVYLEKGDYDKAIEAYQKVLQAPQLRPQTWYNIAIIHAARGDKEEAFKYLQMVRSTGSFDMDQIHSDARLKVLRTDARFEKLIPKPEEFANPFVEKVRVIHEFVSEAKGSQFGWIARKIGDVDGDKVIDFTTSAPTYAVNGQPAGRVYVYSSKSGKLVWAQTGKPGESLGMGVELAGDTNADGISDVVAGAPSADKAYVYSGKDGKVLLTLSPQGSGERFGIHVSTAGDLNGDRHDDVLIGAPGNNAKGQGAGRAYIFSGKDGSLLLALDGEKASDAFGTAVAGYKDKKHSLVIVGAPGAGAKQIGRVYVYEGLSDKPKFIFDADDTGARFGGMFLSAVGDVNRDAVPDIYASDWSNNAKGNSTGRAYVYSGKDGKQLLTLTGEAAGDGFGIGVADAGDVNRDGHADLILGAWQHSSAAYSGGRVYLYSGKDGALLQTYTGRVAGETFGFDATGVEDVDGDGVIDFLFTSAWSGIKGFQSGRLYIVSGKIAR